MSATESVGSASASEGSSSSSPSTNNGPILTTVPNPVSSSLSSSSSPGPSTMPSSSGGGTNKRTVNTNRNPSDRILLSWCGDKHWLLIKEGVHILLDRILIKDTAHLVARSLYSRLSRTEKRAAVVRYASALLQREPLIRNIIVDTISMCVYDACEAEARLEAPSNNPTTNGNNNGNNPDGDTKNTPSNKKKRLPFMQKVIGDALAEMIANNPSSSSASGTDGGNGTNNNNNDKEIITVLIKQKAPIAVVSEAISRIRALWLGTEVTNYFASMVIDNNYSSSTSSSSSSSAAAAAGPALVYDKYVANEFGTDYFLPPIPYLTLDDERHLTDAIRRDEEEAGKETVFAANLKKALKLIKQGRSKTGSTTGSSGGTGSTGGSNGLSSNGSGHDDHDHSSSSSSSSSSSNSPSSLRVQAVSQLARYLSTQGVPVDRLVGVASTSSSASGTSDTANEDDPNTHPSSATYVATPLSAAVPRVVGGVNSSNTNVSQPSTTPSLSYSAKGPLRGWWCDLNWANKHLQPSGIVTTLHRLTEHPEAWHTAWSSREFGEARKRLATGLSAEETCDVIDHQPLWLSLRGMVGSNLYADGIWPITSNDGHLSLARFRRFDRERFWFVDSSSTDVLALAGVFTSWAHVLMKGVRTDLTSLGEALANGALDEVSRGVQRHLESGILCLIALKVAAASIEAEAERSSNLLGDLLLAEEEAKSAKAKAKEREKEEKRKKKEAMAANQTNGTGSTTTTTQGITNESTKMTTTATPTKATKGNTTASGSTKTTTETKTTTTATESATKVSVNEKTKKNSPTQDYTNNDSFTYGSTVTSSAIATETEQWESVKSGRKKHGTGSTGNGYTSTDNSNGTVATTTTGSGTSTTNAYSTTNFYSAFSSNTGNATAVTGTRTTTTTTTATTTSANTPKATSGSAAMNRPTATGNVTTTGTSGTGNVSSWASLAAPSSPSTAKGTVKTVAAPTIGGGSVGTGTNGAIRPVPIFTANTTTTVTVPVMNGGSTHNGTVTVNSTTSTATTTVPTGAWAAIAKKQIPGGKTNTTATTGTGGVNTTANNNSSSASLVSSAASTVPSVVSLPLHGIGTSTTVSNSATTVLSSSSSVLSHGPSNLLFSPMRVNPNESYESTTEPTLETFEESTLPVELSAVLGLDSNSTNGSAENSAPSTPFRNTHTMNNGTNGGGNGTRVGSSTGTFGSIGMEFLGEGGNGSTTNGSVATTPSLWSPLTTNNSVSLTAGNLLDVGNTNLVSALPSVSLLSAFSSAMNTTAMNNNGNNNGSISSHDPLINNIMMDPGLMKGMENDNGIGKGVNPNATNGTNSPSSSAASGLGIWGGNGLSFASLGGNTSINPSSSLLPPTNNNGTTNGTSTPLITSLSATAPVFVAPSSNASLPNGMNLGSMDIGRGWNTANGSSAVPTNEAPVSPGAQARMIKPPPGFTNPSSPSLGGIAPPGVSSLVPDTNNGMNNGNGPSLGGGFMNLPSFGTNGTNNPSSLPSVMGNGFFGLPLTDSATVAAAHLLLAGQSFGNPGPNLFGFGNHGNPTNPNPALSMNTLFSGLTNPNPSSTNVFGTSGGIPTLAGMNNGWNLPSVVPMGNPLLFGNPTGTSTHGGSTTTGGGGNNGNGMNTNNFLNSLPSMLLMGGNNNGISTNGGTNDRNNGIAPPPLPPKNGNNGSTNTGHHPGGW